MRKTLLVLATATLLATFAGAAQATSVSAPQCQAWFKMLDRNADGSLGTSEGAGRFYDKITLAGTGRTSDNQYIMQRSFFLAECRVGSFGTP